MRERTFIINFKRFSKAAIARSYFFDFQIDFAELFRIPGQTLLACGNFFKMRKGRVPLLFGKIEGTEHHVHSGQFVPVRDSRFQR